MFGSSAPGFERTGEVRKEWQRGGGDEGATRCQTSVNDHNKSSSSMRLTSDARVVTLFILRRLSDGKGLEQSMV